jgi:beta-phosphoglucomutase-like phosphatase (HAD superfamily)
MQALQALIFDVDGTLADTERDGHRPAFNRAFREAGLDWDWTVPLYGELLAVTGGKERILHYLRHWQPDFLERPDLADFIAGLHQRKTAHYLDLLRSGAIPLRPGVLRLLGEARDAGIRLAVATTTTPENVTTLLECAGHADLPGWFEVIAAGDIVPAKKPAPDIFVYALRAPRAAAGGLRRHRGLGERRARRPGRRPQGPAGDREHLHPKRRLQWRGPRWWTVWVSPARQRAG